MPQNHSPDTPWGYLRKRRDKRFQQQREELKSYLSIAVPVALRAVKLYEEWRDVVAEPIQDGQKAANTSAVYWWQITNELELFKAIDPPPMAQKYHRLFVDALSKASQGTVATKNGFRFNKFSMVGTGMEYMDSYLELMNKAEAEMGRIVRKYQLIDIASGEAET